MSRTVAAVVLLVRFAWQVVLSGAVTAWIIVWPGVRPAPGLVRMRYDHLTEVGAVLLASLITLTPGTTALDIDPVERTLLLHLLDARDPESAVAGIRRNFERYLRVLFPEPHS